MVLLTFLILSLLWVLMLFLSFRLTGITPLLKDLSENPQWFLKLLIFTLIFSNFLYMGRVSFPKSWSIGWGSFLILLCNIYMVKIPKNRKYFFSCRQACSVKQDSLRKLFCLPFRPQEAVQLNSKSLSTRKNIFLFFWESLPYKYYTTKWETASNYTHSCIGR